MRWAQETHERQRQTHEGDMTRDRHERYTMGEKERE